MKVPEFLPERPKPKSKTDEALQKENEAKMFLEQLKKNKK